MSTRVVYTSDVSHEGRVTHLLSEPVGTPQIGAWVVLTLPETAPLTPDGHVHEHRILVHGQRELQDVDARARIELADGTVVHDPAAA